MDCSHEMAGMMACTMSCCQDADRSMVASVVFVLPPAARPAARIAIARIAEAPRPLEFPRTFEPLSPPPRVEVAAA
jgi:hypothetical protein